MSRSGSLWEPLASGRTADVYTWGEGFVLKLFQPQISLQAVESERCKALTVHNVGLPTPAVGDIIHVDGRPGIVYEHIEGPSMMDKLTVEPDSIGPLARLLADLHHSVHGYRAPSNMPAQTAMLEEKISGCIHLAQAERRAALDAIARLPGGDRLCHGDFHPGNVLLTDRGSMMIDWADASRGNPTADVARTSLLFLGHMATRPAEDPERTAMMHFHQTYLTHYFVGRPQDRFDYERWLPVLAAARLSEGITEQHDWLLQQARMGLQSSPYLNHR